MFECYFAYRIEFLCDSSRIEPIPPNIRNDIVSESGLTRRTSRLEIFFNETSRIPPNKKNQFVAILAICGLCGIGVKGKQWRPRPDTAASDQGLHCLLTDCSHKI